MKDLKKKLLLLTASIIFSLIMAEIIVRLLPVTKRYDMHYLMDELDADIKYLSDACRISEDRLNKNIAKMGSLSNRIYNIEGFNSDGFRDYDYDIEKKDNTFRVIFLGSSWTAFGGNFLDDLFAKRLEVLLNDNSDDIHYEVMLQALRGTHFATKLCILKNYSLKYKPDIVLFRNKQLDLADMFFANERVLFDYLNKRTGSKIKLIRFF